LNHLRSGGLWVAFVGIVLIENLRGCEILCWQDWCHISVLCNVCCKCAESRKNQLWGWFMIFWFLLWTLAVYFVLWVLCFSCLLY